MADRCYEHKTRLCKKCEAKSDAIERLGAIEEYVDEMIAYLEDVVDLSEYDQGRLAVYNAVKAELDE
jgi:DNA-binding SARP family transcriptional activator